MDHDANVATKKSCLDRSGKVFQHPSLLSRNESPYDSPTHDFFCFSFGCRPGNMIAPVNIGPADFRAPRRGCRIGGLHLWRVAHRTGTTAVFLLPETLPLQPGEEPARRSRLVPAAHVRVKRQAFPRSRAAPRKGQLFGVKWPLSTHIQPGSSVTPALQLS